MNSYNRRLDRLKGCYNACERYKILGRYEYSEYDLFRTKNDYNNRTNNRYKIHRFVLKWRYLESVE